MLKKIKDFIGFNNSIGKTMKRKINFQLLLIAIIAIVCTIMASLIIYYDAFRNQVLEDLRGYVHILEKYDIYEGTHEKYYDPDTDNLRITVINQDGTVIFDSKAETSDMENHLTRPEIANAISNGEGQSIRKSKTSSKNTFYVAVKLDNGSVLRVAKESNSSLGLFIKIIPIIIVIIILLIILCIILAHYFTRSIVKPIEEMTDNIDNYTANSSYKELEPFFDRIKNQHKDILKSVMIRQDFTANVSHELKTPLTSISGYSEIIQNKMATEDEVVEFAKKINKSSKRLLTLINDIIKLSELDSTDLEVPFSKVNLNVAAEKCVSALEVNAEKHNVTLVETGESNCYIYGNIELINEIIYNLTDNAIRYNNEGGTVKVFVYSNEDKVILEVKDNGIGIPKEHQDRIFERFYRVDKSRSKLTGGTGLGLAIVKHIVAKHDAKIEIESEVGKGTIIKVIFKKVNN